MRSTDTPATIHTSERLSRLIVFDLDGTLVDSRRDLADAANAVLAAYGCGAHPEHEIGRMVGDGAPMLVARAFAAARCPQPPGALDLFLSIYNEQLLTFTVPYENVHPTLAVLRSRAQLAVLTNKPLDATQRILEGLDLARYFPPSHIVGGDGPLPPKPDPAGLRHLVATAGVTPADTVLVGDSIVDWKTASAAGTRICLARYGFGFDGVLASGLPRDVLIVERFADLEALTHHSS